MIGWLLASANDCICGYDEHVGLVYIDENNFIFSIPWLIRNESKIEIYDDICNIKVVARGNTYIV